MLLKKKKRDPLFLSSKYLLPLSRHMCTMCFKKKTHTYLYIYIYINIPKDDSVCGIFLEDMRRVRILLLLAASAAAASDVSLVVDKDAVCYCATCSRPNQRRALVRLPPELRRRNFCRRAPTEHASRLEKARAKKTRARYVFRLSFHFLHAHRCWLGACRLSRMYIYPNQYWYR